MHSPRYWTSCITLASILAAAHGHADGTSRWDDPKRGDKFLQSAHTGTEADNGLFLSASALYWTAYVSDLDYAMITDDDGTEYKSCKLEWRPGFRIEAGVCTGHDAWTLRGRWTAITPRGSASHNIGSDDELLALVSDLQLAIETEDLGDIAESRMRFSLDYDCVDLTVERPTFWSSSIAVSPFIGLRWLALTQTSRQDFSVDAEEDEFSVKAKWRSMLNAVGLLAGTGCDWHLMRNFSLCGRAAACLLAGRTKDRLAMDVDGNAALVPDLANQRENKWEPTPGYELSLGFQWENQFSQHVYLIARTTYEFQHWFNLSRMRRFATPAVPSDGSSALLHGATGACELHF